MKTAAEMPEARLEVLFVNDGSKDASLSEMKRLAEKKKRELLEERNVI